MTLTERLFEIENGTVAFVMTEPGTASVYNIGSTATGYLNTSYEPFVFRGVPYTFRANVTGLDTDTPAISYSRYERHDGVKTSGTRWSWDAPRTHAAKMDVLILDAVVGYYNANRATLERAALEATVEHLGYSVESAKRKVNETEEAHSAAIAALVKAASDLAKARDALLDLPSEVA